MPAGSSRSRPIWRRLPTAAVEWAPGLVPVLLLGLLCLVVGLGATRVLRRGRWSVALSVVLVVVMVRPLPSPGWPPPGWVLVACDVGQGDGLVLNAGAGSAVVVDTGPDPPAMETCLDRLGVRTLPVVVLTHFHADHVDGLPAVLSGRRVGELDVTATEDPAYGAEEVRRWAAAARVPVRVPAYGEVRRVGDVTWQVVGPVATGVDGHHGEEGSAANNASLVLLVEVRGVRLLLSGDMEPEAQQRLHASLPGAAGGRAQGAAPRQPLPGPRPARCAGRPAGAGLGRPGQRLRPPGRRPTLALLRRAGMRWSAPTRTATSRSPCGTGGSGCAAGRPTRADAAGVSRPAGRCRSGSARPERHQVQPVPLRAGPSVGLAVGQRRLDRVPPAAITLLDPDGVDGAPEAVERARPPTSPCSRGPSIAQASSVPPGALLK